MSVSKVVPSGYCLGVIRAIQIVKQVVEENPDTPIYILGMIVHNGYIVEAFQQLGVISLDDSKTSKMELLDSIDEGIVILTAHGTSPEVKQKALDKGLTVVDATCKYVLKNEALITSYLENDYEVIYIGKKDHPESDAVLAISPKIHLVTDKQSIEELDIDTDKVIITNQTTMSIADIKELVELLKSKYPSAIVEDEICDATRTRQQAILNLTDTDVLVVVGDPNSNNTSQLANIGKLKGIKEVYKVADAKELTKYHIDPNKNISVTAGASTPKCLSENVIKYLETQDDKYLEVSTEKILEL